MNSFNPSYFNDSIPSPENRFQRRSFSFNPDYYGNSTIPTNSSNAPIYIMNPDKAPADGANAELSIGGGAKGNMIPLPFDFIPGNFDVLCGRGKKNYNSLGRYKPVRLCRWYQDHR